MRWLFLLVLFALLTGCAGVSDYTPETGDRTSYTGNQGGAGVQANLWSDDPAKKTVTNQNGTQ